MSKEDLVKSIESCYQPLLKDADCQQHCGIVLLFNSRFSLNYTMCKEAQNDLKSAMKTGNKEEKEEEPRETREKKRKKDKKTKKDRDEKSSSHSNSGGEQEDGEESEDSSDLDQDLFGDKFRRQKKEKKPETSKDMSAKLRAICKDMSPVLLAALPKGLPECPN